MRDSYAYYKDGLDDRFLPIFEKAELFVLSCGIDKVTAEDRLSDLIDMFVSAQADGKRPESIVGEDIKAFCKLFVTECSWKSRILKILDDIKIVFWVMLCVGVLEVMSLVYTTAGFTEFIRSLTALKTPSVLVGICVTGLVAITVNSITRMIMFWVKRISMRVLSVISTFVYFASAFVTFNLTEGYLPEYLNLPLFIVIITGIVYLIVYYICNHKRLKFYRAQKTTLVDAVSTEVGSEYDRFTMKRYIKEKNKALKRKKAELTFETFLNKEEKRCMQKYKLYIFFKIAPYIIVGLSILNDLAVENYYSYLQLCLSSMVLLIIQLLVFRGMWRLIKSSNDIMMSWIKKKRNNM